MPQRYVYLKSYTSQAFIVRGKQANLSQGTLQFSQEVSVTQAGILTVYVVHFKPQLLHHLKVIVDDKCLGKLWAEAVQDFLRPANLIKTFQNKGYFSLSFF